MPTHSIREAFDAVWTGACSRHPGEHPDECGALEDLQVYRNEHEGIESWYLGR